MLTITAILRAKAEHVDAMAEALAAVADHVRHHEPGTRGFFVARQLDDPCVFTTYERFVDRAAMDAHNGSPACQAFYAAAGPMLDGPVTLASCEELLAVEPTAVSQ